MSAFSGLKPSKLKGLVASLEAIDFQKNELLFRNLEIAFDALRKGGDLSDRAIEKAGINKIIKERTGLSVVVRVSDSTTTPTEVSPPIISSDSPLLTDRWKKLFAGSLNGARLIKKSGFIVDGYVDLEKSKVGGVFTELVSDVYISEQILNDKTFTNGEISAMVLHEVGHVFTYFEFLGKSITTNCVLSALGKAWVSNEDKTYRLTLIKEAEEALSVSLEDSKSLSSVEDLDTLRVVFLNAQVKKNRSELGSGVNDMRSWERLSDQFASRHGASKDLAVGTDKIYRKIQSRSHMSTPRFLALEIFKYTIYMGFFHFNILGAATNPFLIAMWVLRGNPLASTYDKPSDRFNRLRNDVVEALKDKSNTKERNERLLSDLDAIDAVLKEIKDRSTFYEYVWRTLVPSGKKQYRQQQLQKDLEDLAANAMFEAAAKFKTLS